MFCYIYIRIYKFYVKYLKFKYDLFNVNEIFL